METEIFEHVLFTHSNSRAASCTVRTWSYVEDIDTKVSILHEHISDEHRDVVFSTREVERPNI